MDLDFWIPLVLQPNKYNKYTLEYHSLHHRVYPAHSNSVTKHHCNRFLFYWTVTVPSYYNGLLSWAQLFKINDIVS